MQPRPGDQGGFTLLEVMMSLGIAALLILPVGMWMILAMRQQGPTASRFTESAQARIANTYLSRDVGSAELVKVTDFGPNPGCGTIEPTDAVLIQLVDDRDDGSDVPLRTVYMTHQEDGLTWLVRRTCLVNTTDSVESSVRILRDVDVSSGPPTAVCTPVDSCRQLTFEAELSGGRSVNVRATRRATLDASFVGSGGNFNPTALIDITSQTGKRPNRTVVLD
ncbi:MAG: type II secretion system protein J, partial [Microthrixaceae bacterium]